MVSIEKVARDLMGEHSTLYSNREQFPITAQMLSDNLRLVFLPYGELWRNSRKLTHHLTMSSAADAYQPIHQERASVRCATWPARRRMMSAGSSAMLPG